MGEPVGVAVVDAQDGSRDAQRKARGRRLASTDLVALAVIQSISCAWVFGRGQLLNIDTLNSHVYVLWSLSHPQQDFAWGPGGPGSYLPATWNLPWWVLAEHGPPWVAGLFLALLHGSTIWLVWLLARRLCSRGVSEHVVLLPALSAAFAFGSAMFLFELGSTFGDVATAPLIIGSLVVLAGAPVRVSARQWVLAGALTGMAFGLKLTNGPYVLALLAVCPLWSMPGRRLRATAWTAAGSMSGALATGGWWWIKMAERFGNPVFPFLGGRLHSSYGSSGDISDARWRLSPLGILAMPWRMATDGYPVETTFRDARWALLVVLLACAVVHGAVARRPPATGTSALLAYLGVAFAVWAVVFGYGRYLLTADLVVAPVVVALTFTVVGRRRIAILLASTAVGSVLAASLQLLPSASVGWDERWTRVAVPALLQQRDLLVVLPSNDGLSYVSASLPDDARIVQVPSVFGTLVGLEPAGAREGFSSHREDAEIRDLIRRHSGPIVALADSSEVAAAQQLAREYGRVQVAATSCQSLQVHVMHLDAARIALRVPAGSGAPLATSNRHTALACVWR